MSEREEDDLAAALHDPTPRADAKRRLRSAIAGRLERERARWRVQVALLSTAAAGALLFLLWMRGHDPARAPAAIRADRPLVDLRVLPSGGRVLATAGDVSALVDDARGTTLELRSGTLLAHVAKRPASRPFRVIAGPTQVEVVGTTFAVAFGADRSVIVQVFEGTVAVETKATRHLVPAGSSLPAGVSLAVGAADLARVKESPPAFPPVPPASSPPALVPPAMPSPGHSAPSTSPPGGTAPDPVPAGAAPRGNYLRAKEAEGAGSTEKAIALYRDVVRAGDPETEDALYATASWRTTPRIHAPGGSVWRGRRCTSLEETARARRATCSSSPLRPRPTSYVRAVRPPGR